MELTERDFQILDALDRYEITTQRQLAAHAGISLGQVNYVIKGLLEKGHVKLGNFRKSPSKISYAYLLTPKGIEEKSRLAFSFVMRRLNDYNSLRQILEKKMLDIENQGLSRIIIVGPKIIQVFLSTIIKENNNELVITGQCNSWEDLRNYAPDSFDVALLFDGNAESIKTINKIAGTPKAKLMPLW